MRRAVVAAVVIGLAGAAVTFWVLGEDLRTAGNVPAWAYAIGLCLTAANYLAGATRLRILARHAGERLGFVAALRAYALGLFSAAVTPGAAGQAPAVALSLVAGGMTGARAWSLNVRVWVLDLVFLGWSLPLSILVLGRSTRLFSSAHPLALAVGVFVAAALLVTVLLFRLRWLTRLAGQVMRLRGLRRWRGEAEAFLERVDVASSSLGRAPLTTQAALHATTVLVYLTTYLAFFVMVAAMRPGAPLLATMASAQVPSVLASFFPTPGGAGLLEVGTASLLRLSSRSAVDASAPVASEDQEGTDRFGGTPGAAGILAATDDSSRARAPVAAAILAWRICTFYLRIVVGAVLGGSVLRRRQDAD